jgi:hypothetical protein
MKVASAKAKGRRLQQKFMQLLIEELNIDPEDIESRSMGAGGEDLIMSKAARTKFPFSVECKNQERMNIWSAWEQAINNKGIYEPLVVIKKNGVDPLVVLDAKVFMNYVKEFNNDN